MEDYPRSLAELETRFGTEQACRDYLMKLRWPEFVCPHCNTQSAWGTSRNLQVCTKCQYQGASHSGHDISGYAETTDIVVPGNLVGYHSEEWCQRLGCATDSGTGQLHHGMDLAA